MYDIASCIAKKINVTLAPDDMTNILKNGQFGICRFSLHYMKRKNRGTSIDKITSEFYIDELHRYFEDDSVKCAVLMSVFLFSGIKKISRIFDMLRSRSVYTAYTQIEINQCVGYLLKYQYITQPRKGVFKFVDAGIERAFSSRSRQGVRMLH